ncbi:MAG TPA: hypothetical protein VK404_12530 [Spirosoma sp.]|nr:hypothetical protein [Spirosoma sp.]
MVRTLLFTTLLAIAFFVVERYYITSWLHPDWKMLLVFFMSVSFLTSRLISAGLQGDRERLVPMYLAATVARMVLGLAFVGFFLFHQIEERRTFVFDFLVLYICYTCFEIWALTRNLRHNS